MYTYLDVYLDDDGEFAFALVSVHDLVDDILDGGGGHALGVGSAPFVAR